MVRCEKAISFKRSILEEEKFFGVGDFFIYFFFLSFFFFFFLLFGLGLLTLFGLPFS